VGAFVRHDESCHHSGIWSVSSASLMMLSSTMGLRLFSSLLAIDATIARCRPAVTAASKRAAFHSCSISSATKGSMKRRSRYPHSLVAVTLRAPSATPLATMSRHCSGGAAVLPLGLSSTIIVSSHTGGGASSLALSTLQQ